MDGLFDTVALTRKDHVGIVAEEALSEGIQQECKCRRS